MILRNGEKRKTINKKTPRKRRTLLRGNGHSLPWLVWLYVAGALLVVCLIGLTAFLFIQDLALSSQIFKGITVDKKAVGGLSRSQAQELISKRIAAPLEKPLVFEYSSKRFPLSPKSIDFRLDTRAMIEIAYWQGQDQFILARMFRRLFGKQVRENVPVIYTYNSDKLKKFVADLAKILNYDSSSARIDMSAGSPKIVASKNGLRVKQEETIKAAQEALQKPDRHVQIVTESIPPEFTEDKISYIIVVRQSEHTLYLFDRESVDNSYTIAVGMPQYPTPNGKFHITYKEKNPTWLPTSEWAKDKQGIPQPPGPDNPLGGYWMDIGGGIGMHATPYEKTLGQSASHGCIRMAEWAAADLFGKVKVGTPVYIVP